MPETKEITYMWLKVGMPLHKALITGKRVVRIMHEATIRDYSALKGFQYKYIYIYELHLDQEETYSSTALYCAYS